MSQIPADVKELLRHTEPVRPEVPKQIDASAYRVLMSDIRKGLVNRLEAL